MERICPRCGRKDSDVSFVGERCLPCVLEGKIAKWPKKIEAERCMKCGKIRRGNEWKEFAPSLLAALASECMKGIPGHYNIERQVWEGIWEQGRDSAPFEHPLPIEEKRAVCPTCNRSSSGYFEGIIQLRGNPKKVEKYALLLQKLVGKHTFIPRVEDMHGGVDIYVGEKREVPEILFHQKLKYVRTEKLAGEKKGKRLYRSTFLIRFDEEGGTGRGGLTSGG